MKPHSKSEVRSYWFGNGDGGGVGATISIDIEENTATRLPVSWTPETPSLREWIPIIGRFLKWKNWFLAKMRSERRLDPYPRDWSGHTEEGLISDRFLLYPPDAKILSAVERLLRTGKPEAASAELYKLARGDDAYSAWRFETVWDVRMQIAADLQNWLTLIRVCETAISVLGDRRFSTVRKQALGLFRLFSPAQSCDFLFKHTADFAADPAFHAILAEHYLLNGKADEASRSVRRSLYLDSQYIPEQIQRGKLVGLWKWLPPEIRAPGLFQKHGRN